MIAILGDCQHRPLKINSIQLMKEIDPIKYLTYLQFTLKLNHQ